MSTPAPAPAPARQPAWQRYHFRPTRLHKNAMYWVACYLVLAVACLACWMLASPPGMQYDPLQVMSVSMLAITALSFASYRIRAMGAPLGVMAASTLWQAAVVLYVQPRLMGSVGFAGMASTILVALAAGLIPILPCLPFRRSTKAVKEEFRAEAIAARKAIAPAERAEATKAANQRLLGLIEQRVKPNSGYIAVYAAVASELSLEPLILALAEKGYRVAYPAILGDSSDGYMEFYSTVGAELDLEALELIADPFAAKQAESLGRLKLVEPSKIAVIVVPGVAFDSARYRMGFGGGFYDRYIERLPARTLKVGACFEQQYCRALPIERHDQALDAVVTPSFVHTARGVE